MNKFYKKRPKECQLVKVKTHSGEYIDRARMVTNGNHVFWQCNKSKKCIETNFFDSWENIN